jgi:hypothetical protein
MVALAFPAAALAVRYLGPLNNGASNAGIEIDVKFDGKTPKKVNQFEWHNLGPFCGSISSYVFFKDMAIQNGKFKGSGHPGQAGNSDWPPNKNIIETIRGTLKNHDKKIVGTLRIQGDPGGACPDVDTGKLPYVAK